MASLHDACVLLRLNSVALCVTCACDSEVLDKETFIRYCQPNEVSITWHLAFAVSLMEKVDEKTLQDEAALEDDAEGATQRAKQDWMMRTATERNDRSSECHAELERQWDQTLHEGTKDLLKDKMVQSNSKRDKPYFLSTTPLPLPLAVHYIYKEMRNRRRPVTTVITKNKNNLKRALRARQSRITHSALAAHV